MSADLRARIAELEAEVKQLTGQLDDTQCELADARLEFQAAEVARQAEVAAAERWRQEGERAEADLARSKDVAIREAEQVRSERNRYAERAEQAEVKLANTKRLLDNRVQDCVDLAQRAEQAEAELEQWRACFGETALKDARGVLAERDRLREELRLARFDKERAEATVARLRVLRDDYWRLPGCSEIGDDLDVALSPEEN